MILDILFIITGIIFFIIGLIATIIAFGFVDPIDHIWSVPLIILGIFAIYMGLNNIIDIKVNERIEQYQVQNIVEKARN